MGNTSQLVWFRPFPSPCSSKLKKAGEKKSLAFQTRVGKGKSFGWNLGPPSDQYIAQLKTVSVRKVSL